VTIVLAGTVGKQHIVVHSATARSPSPGSRSHCAVRRNIPAHGSVAFEREKSTSGGAIAYNLVRMRLFNSGQTRLFCLPWYSPSSVRRTDRIVIQSTTSHHLQSHTLQHPRFASVVSQSFRRTAPSSHLTRRDKHPHDALGSSRRSTERGVYVCGLRSDV
jgi:hypothetical protein